jgi:hypothetical protein
LLEQPSGRDMRQVCGYAGRRIDDKQIIGVPFKSEQP